MIYTLIKGIVVAGQLKKTYEETSIFKDELWKKMVAEKPKEKEVIIILSTEGGFLSKGFPISPCKVKPIIG